MASAFSTIAPPTSSTVTSRLLHNTTPNSSTMASHPFPSTLPGPSAMDVDINMSNGMPITSPSSKIAENKNLEAETIAALRKSRKTRKRSKQSRLAREVRRTQREPDHDLDNALAAFSLSSGTAIASNASQAEAADPPSQRGHYNSTGHFVMGNPSAPKPRSTPILLSGASKVAGGEGITKRSRKLKNERPTQKVAQLTPLERRTRAAPVLANLRPADYGTKLNEMKRDLGLKPGKTDGVSQLKLRWRIINLYDRWAESQSMKPQEQDTMMDTRAEQEQDASMKMGEETILENFDKMEL